MLSTGAVASVGFRGEHDEAQTRNGTLVAELAESQGLVAKAVTDLSTAQAELAVWWRPRERGTAARLDAEISTVI